MVGLESPEPLRATVFGTGNGLLGLSIAVVPVLAGLVAARADVSAAILGLSAGAVVSGAAVFIFGREPPDLSRDVLASHSGGRG